MNDAYDNTGAPASQGLDGLPMLVGSAGEPLTMSSREIADLCEKQHQHVRRDIDAMCEALKINASTFGRIYLDARNREQTEYHIPKDLTLTLVAGYNVVLRKRIIDRWLELESQGRPAKLTGPQLMAAALIEANATLQAQAQQIEAMAEDVAAHERLVKAEGSVTITEAAKNLGIRPGSLFDWLSRNGWIYKRPGSASWLGYQDKCNRGLLEHKSTTVLRADGSEKITEQVRITAKGLSALAKLIPPTAQLVA